MTAKLPMDTGCSILVVDDFPMMRKIISRQLDSLGFAQVDTAGDGTEALQRLGEKHYDLVISDWNMTPVSGNDLVRAIRSDPALAHIRILMITAESRTETLLAARAAGANTHLLKPFDSRTLGVKIALARAA